MTKVISLPVRSKAEQALGWGALALLLGACALVLRPFVSDLLWAAVLCCSLWPVYRWLLVKLGRRRNVASGLLALGMVLLLVVPFVIISATLADNVKDLSAAAQKTLTHGLPAPPQWLSKVPVVGPSAVEYWQNLSGDGSRLWKEARRFIEPASAGLLKLGLLVAGGLLHLALSVVITFFLLRDGEALAMRLTAALTKISGNRAQGLLAIAISTIRGVIYGLLGTALCQAILAGIGFLIAGVPGAGVLALLTFFVSIIPLLGTALIWLPAAIWLFVQGATGWGIFLIVWGLGVNNIEYILKPLLIGKGSDMPLLLTMFGLVGGAAAFGFIGVFLGPTLLAVGYRIVREWVVEADSAQQFPVSEVQEEFGPGSGKKVA